MSQQSNEGYEAKDATFKPVFFGMIIIFTLTALGLFVSAIFYLGLEKSWVKSQDASSENAVHNPLIVPSPQLEAVPAKDYQEFKIEQERALNSYGWINPAQKKIHIPIDVAMKNALKKGFMVREKKDSEIVTMDVPLESGGMKKGLG